MPLHILLVPMGTPGDVQPFIDIGSALRARGHRATLVANAFFREWAKNANLDFIELGTADEYQRLIDDKNLWTLHKAHRVFAKKLVLKNIERLYRIIEKEHGADMENT